MAGVLSYLATRSRATTRPRPRLALVAALLAFVAVLGACSEDLDGGAACGTLCPGTELDSREVTLTALVDEDVVPAILETGSEPVMPLIDRKDTVQTRIAIRFDTLITQYADSVTDSLFTIDTLTAAALVLTFDRTPSTVQDSVVFDVFDVDDGTDDTTAAGIESRMTEARRIGTRRVAKATLDGTVGDTVQLPLDAQYMLSILRRTAESQRRLRVAVRATSPRSLVLQVLATVGSQNGPLLTYRHPKAAGSNSMVAYSDVPSDLTAKRALADFTTIPVRPARRTDPVFAIGGLPARRTVLRFAIPDSIDAAAAIIQAELRLVQVPDPVGALRDTVLVDSTTGLRERADTVVVLPLIGVGGSAVIDDPVRAGQLAVRQLGDLFAVPALRVAASDSGLRTIDLAGLLRRWRKQSDADPRYLVLTAASEAAQSATAYFRSSLATDATQRPTLYIRYVPSVGYGIP
jgi:hypothetical protein